MKKFLAVLVMAVVFMVGCGSKVEPITLDEVTGYWYEEAQDVIYEFTEDGTVIVHAAIKQGGEVISRFGLPLGAIECGDEVIMTLVEETKAVCKFSDDKNTITMEADGETEILKRISADEAKALGVEK